MIHVTVIENGATSEHDVPPAGYLVIAGENMEHDAAKSQNWKSGTVQVILRPKNVA